jgi:surfactin synthase thioesterase subunit
MQLFCVPHAGSSALNYHKWRPYLTPDINIIPLELAGRGIKSNIALYSTFEEAAEDIFHDFRRLYTGEKYALFGHSLGCWLVYELYYRIEQEGVRIPEALFLSGHYPPFLNKVKEKPCADMDDEEFIEKITLLGGTNELVFQDEELRKKYLHILKSDFMIAEEFQCRERPDKIKSNVVVLGGTLDGTVNSGELLLWRKAAGANCTVCKITGDHFFPFTNYQQTVSVINEILIH